MGDARYNRGMRRRTRLGVIIAVLLLIVAAGGYTAFWFIVAGKLKQGFAQWAQSEKAQQLDVSWRGLQIGGFPFAFAIELSGAVLRGEGIDPPTEIRMPRLTGSAHPWNFRVWHLSAPQGLTVVAGPEAKPVATLTGRAATGAVSAMADGGSRVWLSVDALSVDSGEKIGMRNADFWVVLPPHAPATHTDSNLALAADLHQLKLPRAPSPFHDLLDELALGLTIKGAIPPGPPRQAAAAWRDEGGTAELDKLTLHWGQVVVTGSGTLALDGNLQPIGGFSGSVEGYEELMNALVAAGKMKPSDAQLARIGLAMLAKAGPDGRPAITTSFTIQNGEMFLGPAKLGPAPKISWE
ncbi:MAG: DUF2125 domain-containing protein [Alphaproteobacteria bacterium]|nr:DUF2125 domain-containing protein [Alphaproteobacteria bacterium]MBV9966583.1 DUF2125 domain-containing protein [Alphaproteobacteria bacterium]